MAQVSETTLRLEILRAACDDYKAYRSMLSVTPAECMLYDLKIAECEAMISELLTPTQPQFTFSGGSRYDENDEPRADWEES